MQIRSENEAKAKTVSRSEYIRLSVL